MANRVLELVPVGGREVGGLVELDRALGILAEHAVDDTDVEMEVSVQRRAETMEVLLDQRVERRLSGTAPAVDGPTVWCGGPKGRP